MRAAAVKAWRSARAAKRDVKEENQRDALHEHGQFHGGAMPGLVARAVHDEHLAAVREIN